MLMGRWMNWPLLESMERQPMRNPRDSFCSYCGREFARPLRYPRKCQNPSCGADVYANPIPVALVLLPVTVGEQTGLLVVRRAIEPQLGKLALVGGFVEEFESWQQGAAREVREEAGLVIDPTKLVPYHFASTEPRPNRVLLFTLGPTLRASDLPTFVPNHEVSERGVIFGTQGLEPHFAFSLHLQMATRFFDERRIAGPHRFQPL
jgi:ADP-ribose pyrophosphatase YjhB (NUDIX family)